MKNFKKNLSSSIASKLAWVLFFAWSYPNSYAAYLNIDVPIGQAQVTGEIDGDAGVHKIGAGTAVFPIGQTYTGKTNVLEGTLINEGALQSQEVHVEPDATFLNEGSSLQLVNVEAGGGFVGTGTVDKLANVGNVAISGDVGSFLTVHDYDQSSATSSSLLIRVSPSGVSDYLAVDTASLTGALKVFFEAGTYPSDGITYRVVRGGTLTSLFTSFVNVNRANVSLSYEYDLNNFYLIVRGIDHYIPPTATTYVVGKILSDERRDTILVGSRGGFEGFTMPGSACKSLYINFVQSGSAAEQNTTLTNSYTGVGEVPHLPKTVKDLWIQGDTSGFERLVAGGKQYALPTPHAHTTIHFLLSRSPATSPLSWFQGPLPVGCRLVIELDSADPFINTVLPTAGQIILGAPVAPAVGFSDLLALNPCSIQRHPGVVVGDAASKALITLAETTTFPRAVNGISLAGPYQTTFCVDSDLVSPDAESTLAGYNVDPHSTLSIYRAHGQAPLPAIASYLAPGGTSNITIVTSAPKLPKLSPPLEGFR